MLRIKILTARGQRLKMLLPGRHRIGLFYSTDVKDGIPQAGYLIFRHFAGKDARCPTWRWKGNHCPISGILRNEFAIGLSVFGPRALIDADEVGILTR